MKRRSAFGKGAGARPRSPRRFRRPDDPSVAEAIAALPAVGPVRFDSLEELLGRLRRRLAREDPLFALGPSRLRTLATKSGLVRWRIDYRSEAGRPPFVVCPVCRGPLAPVRNRTLEGDSVTLGQSCRACGYWSQRERRVPVRYRGVVVRRHR